MEDKQTKLTESQLGDVVDTLKNNVPKVIERQRKVALEAKPEDKLIEHIVQATVNPESGDPVILLNQIMVDDGNGNLAGSGKTIEDVLATFEPMSDEAIDNLFAK